MRLEESFTRQGTMIAFPLCFPGASAPIPADESHITALDIAPDGTIHGGTSGRRVHIFAADLRGAKGAVFDMGAVEDATYCAAICCGRDKFIACLNGPEGGRVIRGRLQRLPHDLIQEWGFRREGFEDLGEIVPGERTLHAIADSSREKAILLTERHLASVEIESGLIEVIGELEGSGRLALGSEGDILGMDGSDSLWRYDPLGGSLTRKAIPLPEGSWGDHPLFWAKDPVDGRLYTADDDGRLFSFAEGEGFSEMLGKTPFSPVGPMAVTFDGRLFGMCGAEMANLFCYDPADRSVTRLGVPVSVIERRRYGYVFGDAVLGPDGQIFFGEDDELGHLWIYFPSISHRRV
ncbi:TPA: hypothetical protein EYP37_09980 [Candidatus Poribacteria bacterium]|nr:hypothetical protein [Candidatus Poribacteria bacterium]